MFCTNCGKPVADGIKFCTGCGALMEAGGAEAEKEVSAPMNPGKRAMLIAATAMALLAVLAGIMKWGTLGDELLFLDFETEFHIWDLPRWLWGLAKAMQEKRLIVPVLAAMLPLLLWLTGAVFLLAGGVLALMKVAQKKWQSCFMASVIFQTVSALSFLAAMYGVKFLLNRAVRKEAEKNAFFAAVMNLTDRQAGDLIQVSFWPWIMLILSAGALVLLVISGGDKTAAQTTEGIWPVPDPIPDDGRVPMQEVFGSPENLGNPGSPAGPVSPGNLGSLANSGKPAPGLVIFQDRRDASKIYGCDLEKPVIVGRDPGCCNVIMEKDSSISRKHCRLFRSGSTCFVEDLNSFNHTYVNEVMISTPVPLQKGDILKLGNVELIVTECDV